MAAAVVMAVERVAVAVAVAVAVEQQYQLLLLGLLSLLRVFPYQLLTSESRTRPQVLVVAMKGWMGGGGGGGDNFVPFENRNKYNHLFPVSPAPTSDLETPQSGNVLKP